MKNRHVTVNETLALQGLPQTRTREAFAAARDDAKCNDDATIFIR
jgi:hypothetical protein